MTDKEFRNALAGLGYSPSQFAELVGASPRTGYKWSTGEARLPGAVILIVELMQKRPDVVEDVEALGYRETRERAA